MEINFQITKFSIVRQSVVNRPDEYTAETFENPDPVKEFRRANAIFMAGSHTGKYRFRPVQMKDAGLARACIGGVHGIVNIPIYDFGSSPK